MVIWLWYPIFKICSFINGIVFLVSQILHLYPYLFRERIDFLIKLAFIFELKLWSLFFNLKVIICFGTLNLLCIKILTKNTALKEWCLKEFHIIHDSFIVRFWESLTAIILLDILNHV